MMKRTLVLASVIAGLAFGQDFTFGSKVSDFSLQDLKGNPVQFSSLKGDTTVILFVATQCPISNDYNERMVALHNDYAPKGVKFVGINSNHSEPAAEVESHAQKWGFPFKVYKDDNNVIADRFAATVTPEVFVLDKSGAIVYHGSIDDSQQVAKVKTHRLRNALDAVLNGGTPEVSQTKAFGCTIKRVKKAT